MSSDTSDCRKSLLGYKHWQMERHLCEVRLLISWGQAPHIDSTCNLDNSGSAGEVKKVIGLVGKGLTFDSGGYNLKVGGMIEMMKFDMGGAGAVLGAAQAIAGIKPDGVEVSKSPPGISSLQHCLATQAAWGVGHSTSAIRVD